MFGDEVGDFRVTALGADGAVVSLVQVALVGVVCQFPALSLPITQRVIEPSAREETESVMVSATAVSEP